MFCRTINGNALNIPLADKSVQTCITSPPYWGLRDYGTAEWVGGSGNCDHVDKAGPVNNPSSKSTLTTNNGKGPLPGDKYSNTSTAQYKTQCPKCGAIRKDAQLGLEQTPDEFLTNMVNVFREVWRVLKDDGVIWVNMGDSYASNKSGSSQPQETLAKSGNNRGRKVGHTGLRDKRSRVRR